MSAFIYTYASPPPTSNTNINGYNVNVVYASDLDNFYALVHTPEAGFASFGGTVSRDVNFANFDAFKVLEDDKVICTSYIGKDRIAAASYVGFIFGVSPEKMYVAYGHDIYSISKNIPNMIIEYYRSKGIKSGQGKGDKFAQRTMVSDNLKKMLNLSDEQYSSRIENLKTKANGRTITIDLIRQIDPELASAYDTFLAKTNAERGNSDALMRTNYWNEVLVSNPTITAIYTKDIKNLPDEYLKKAQEENLPIVILK